MRKVSCGKLYEELAYLRKEITTLQRQKSELELRANEDFNQQLAEELAVLRDDKKAMQVQIAELQCRNSDLEGLSNQDGQCSLDVNQVNSHIEEIRQQAVAESERTKDHLGILQQQNDKLQREINELRRERTEQARNF
mmetsp:Transcript_59825/g.134909  ORF Transcript_59825/g.134909 Transcript_59825/m.134909 type:complete len:138 (+) Transcript_59825:1-414(+)